MGIQNKSNWAKFTWAGRKQTVPRLFLWSIVTAWLCFFFTFSTPSARAGTTTDGSGSSIQQIQQSVSPTTPTTTIASPNANAKPEWVISCIFWYIFFILLAAGIILMALWALCKAAHLCGGSGNAPPVSPGGNGANVASKGVFASVVVNTNVSLPSTVFYYSGGILVSNSAGLPNSTLPAFITVNGQPLSFGSEIQDAPPGITTPPSIGVWTETNTYYDPNLDPSYPYVAIYNFSLLTTTNLATGWNEMCTIVGWVNENPTTPLVCYITYTNNVPLATNWAQCYLNSYKQPTNIVVYGVLPNLPALSALPLVKPNDGIYPPGSGGGSTNYTPGVFDSSGRFFELTCNTNAVSTGWVH